MIDALNRYITMIQKELADGNATEPTHRPALKTLMETIGGKDVTATNEPKRVECGAPDYVITRSTTFGPLSVGYIETKDVDTKATNDSSILNGAEDSEQMKRYLRSLSNLILTDYLEFRWYIDGEHRRTARLARMGKGGRVILDRDGEEAVINLLQDFLSHAPEPISTPKDLAQRMARLTHIIRDVIVQAFENEKASDLLRDMREAFATALIPDLDQPEKTDEFADMYAQTIAYGLFAARCNH